jgi:glycosyltransferase involved in cell wall biosynthesis
MAAGLPTIGTPVGGIVDFLHEGKTGWLCEVSNPRSIADKVLYVLDPANAEEVAAVVRRGQQLVAEKYDWVKVAAALGQIFTKLCRK